MREEQDLEASVARFPELVIEWWIRVDQPEGLNAGMSTQRVPLYNVVQNLRRGLRAVSIQFDSIPDRFGRCCNHRHRSAFTGTGVQYGEFLIREDRYNFESDPLPDPEADSNYNGSSLQAWT